MTARYKHNPYSSLVLSSSTDAISPLPTELLPPPYTHKDVNEDLLEADLETCAMQVALSGLSDGDRSSSDEENEEEEVWGREDSKLDLSGAEIPFYKYDSHFRSCNEGALPISACTKLFAGQLPYQMPPSAVMWLLWVVTGVHAVKVEKIVRWKKNKQPCGCFHIFCLPRDVEVLLKGNECALVDGDGVWVARERSHVMELQRFCASLAQTKALRAVGLPYQLVTVQPARSTYARPSAARRAQQQQQQNQQLQRFSPAPEGGLHRHPQQGNNVTVRLVGQAPPPYRPS